MTETPPPLTTELESLLQQALRTQRIDRQAHFQLISKCLSDVAIAPEQRQRINQVLDQIQMGKITFVPDLAAAFIPPTDSPVESKM